MENLPQRKQPPPPSPEPVTPSPMRDIENVAPYVPGGGTISDRKRYNQYRIDQGASGNTPLTFQEWLAAGKP